MEANYYALFIAIMKDCTPEQAFDLYYEGHKTRGEYYGNREIDRHICELRGKGMTNREIGERIGLSPWAVSKRYNKYKKAMEAQKKEGSRPPKM